LTTLFVPLQQKGDTMSEAKNSMVYYSWKEFSEDVGKLVNLLQPKFFCQFDGVYGIPAGGLVLAVCLHHQLELPLLLAPTKDTLVVDDIVDSGRTIAHYILKGNFTASLFYKENNICAPYIWLRKKTDAWIHFPWEGGA
jgi:hypoxanthine phosphoribosyltransferase